MAPVRFDLRSLNTGDRIAGISSVALMVGAFLPWFEFGSNATGYFSFSAIDLRHWMYVPFFVSLAIVGSVAVRGMRRPARMPVLHLLVLVAACDVNLFLTVVCFVKKSPGLSWDFGAYVSVAAAVAALVGAMTSRRRPTRVLRGRSVKLPRSGASLP
jgi:peptidoglycan/LPS O-acetylase OafA/YrhL